MDDISRLTLLLRLRRVRSLAVGAGIFGELPLGQSRDLVYELRRETKSTHEKRSSEKGHRHFVMTFGGSNSLIANGDYVVLYAVRSNSDVLTSI